jgi:hypothetical protein
LDLQAVRFAHAVNTRVQLSAFLEGAGTIAEGDATLGQVEGRPANTPPQPVMAHPPESLSDLPFQAWVEALLAHGRGLKVDLKTPDALDPVVQVLSDLGVPLGLLLFNADVVSGVGAPAALLEPRAMAQARAVLGPDLILSVGSTTHGTSGPYPAVDVVALLDAVQRLGGPVTTCLRADRILAGPDVVDTFRHNGHHLTVWNDPERLQPEAGLRARLEQVAPGAWIDLGTSTGHAPSWDRAASLS